MNYLLRSPGIHRRALRRQEPRHRSVLEFLPVPGHSALPSSPPVRKFYRGGNYSAAGGDRAGKRTLRTHEVEVLPPLTSHARSWRATCVSTPDLKTGVDKQMTQDAWICTNVVQFRGRKLWLTTVPWRLHTWLSAYRLCSYDVSMEPP